VATSWGGSHFQGCHGYLPSAFGIWLPTNPLGTSSQAHLHVFVMSLKRHLKNENLGLLRWAQMLAAMPGRELKNVQPNIKRVMTK